MVEAENVVAEAEKRAKGAAGPAESPGSELLCLAVSAVEKTRRRLAAHRLLVVLSRYAPGALLLLTPWALAHRFGLVGAAPFWIGTLGVSLGFSLFVARAVGKAPTRVAAALLLDRAHGLSGRLSGALDVSGAFEVSQVFSRSVPPTPLPSDPYRALGVKQLRGVGPLSALCAVPFVVPRTLPYGALMLVCWGGLVLLPLRGREAPFPENLTPKETSPDRWLSEDDAELLENRAAELTRLATTEEGKEAAERFNEIVLRASRGELSQEQALRLTSELSADLEGAGKQSESWHQGVKSRGTSLEKRDITSSAGRALREGRYKDAEEALRALAERLRSEQEPLSAQEMQELRDSLEETRKNAEAEQRENSLQAQADEKRASELRETEKRLLKKKEEGGLTSEESQQLSRAKRELERLDRKKQQTGEAAAALSELDRELREAAKQLMSERQKSGEFLDQAAESVQKGAQKQLSEAEKKELLQQLKALTERLRNAQSDSEREKRLKEFLERARGAQGQDGKPSEQGGKPGAGGPGGSGQPQLMPGDVTTMAGGEKDGAGESEQGSEPGAGKEPGHAHDPNLTGSPSRLGDSSFETKAAVAQDTGEGESASETILSAAEEGFVSGTYEKLFREYEAVAEEVMEKDAIPPGREAQVLRYFELIRPRKTQGSKEQK